MRNFGLPPAVKNETGDQLRLETIFVVPYKAMAVEGYYWPTAGAFDSGTLVPGNAVPRGTLDRIVAHAGIPPQVLDEINVEHEISCETGEPLWAINWSDVRLVGDEDPDAVIERAYRRFLAIHQSVVEHNAREQNLQLGHGPAPVDDRTPPAASSKRGAPGRSASSCRPMRIAQTRWRDLAN